MPGCDLPFGGGTQQARSAANISRMLSTNSLSLRSVTGLSLGFVFGRDDGQPQILADRRQVFGKQGPRWKTLQNDG